MSVPTGASVFCDVTDHDTDQTLELEVGVRWCAAEPDVGIMSEYMEIEWVSCLHFGWYIQLEDEYEEQLMENLHDNL